MAIHEKMKKIVKDICKETGTKQKFWGEKCGYGEKQFSLILNGYKTITDLEIKKFCIGMSITPNDLIDLNADTA